MDSTIGLTLWLICFILYFQTKVMESFRKKYWFLVVILIGFLPCYYLYAENIITDTNKNVETGNIKLGQMEKSDLTEDWKSFWNKLTDNGIKPGVIYRGELFSIISGNNPKKSSYLDNFDITLDIDLAKLTGWDGASIYFHGIGSHGRDPAELEGIRQGVSNIAAPNTWKIFQLFMEQKLLNDKLSILLGMFDLNTHYDVKIVESLFINPSHGIGTDFSQSGRNGPSVFPSASLGIRLRATPLKNNYIQFAVLDGVPGHPNDPNGTYINLDKSDGLLVCCELGYVKGNKKCIISCDDDDKHQPYTKLGIGTWFYTQGLYHVLKNPDNWGFYLLLEQDIYQDETNPSERLSITGRFGIADDRVNQFDNFISGSISFNGIFTDSDRDQLGFAFSYAHNSYLFRTEREQKGLNTDDFEKIYELTYKYLITANIGIQPDIQYIISPSKLEYPAKPLIFGVRLILMF
ncbi:MAG: hypothetical protein HW421_1506 [Ignavibacteria bacterium]|nr:hypothetical protein [Ignavibacteria bacterium]